MNSQSSAQTLTTSVMLTPHGAIVLTFMAIILGTTLVEFNDVLFPPKFGSLNFWALIVVYYGAFTTWFGIVTAASGRPYRDTFLARTWLMCGIMMLVAYVAVMFFAYNTVNSLFYYLWGWVGVFFFYGTSSLFRYLDLRRPEPFRLCAFWDSSVIAIAVIYSIWSILFPPIPMIANWIFLLVSFVNISGYRAMLRTTHAWQPTPTDQQ